MREFLIKPVDSEWFDFDYKEVKNILRPESIPYRQISGWGTNRLEIDGVEISFSDEMAGIQVCFETGELTLSRMKEVINDICSNIHKRLGVHTRIVDLG